ncbi:sugar-binding domain-containing protein [uncultured Draconibacterium sp.]|uniref:glycoside hydrolase family 2 protein n=1 Tax=uncultured Draconibacterium sp. TaxID=1573823 RepID=UPI0029C74604|nr:sugar-binding domain-containing protein [uncultured Draconibacterium sp.]
MKFKLTAIILFISITLFAQEWKPAGDKIKTRWAETVTPENAWKEYPRPQMVRPEWHSLNGLWEYAVTKNNTVKPEVWEKNILVPFALETPLSGVGRRIESNEVIWYKRSFELSPKANERQLLNFEGVDYKCMVWVNGKLAGSHIGGNLPFSFDVTDLVKAGENEVKLRVIDGTDDPDLYQLRGKQKRDNGGIWYTPSSGIWAPVWIESVPKTYIQSVKLLADMYGELKAEATIGGLQQKAQLQVTVLDNNQAVAQKKGECNSVLLSVKNAKLWSPSSPKLYDLKIELLDEDGNVLDVVSSYAGFRTVGKECDAEGNWQFTLNGEKIFHLGPLDQGWWPESFLLPPSDEAIVWEMDFLKKAGFNMIRKHKKAEIRRYYYHADQMGFVIWQDQTSGGSGGSEWPKWKRPHMEREDYVAERPNQWHKGDPLDADWPDWAHELYKNELKTMIDVLYNHPSVVVWTTFNERWGQHRSMEVGNWVEAYDPSRLLNIASGGNFVEVGDIADQHEYPHPNYPLDVPLYNDYIKVVGEFGGHGWAEKGHIWDTSKRNWGYGGMPKTKEEYIERYTESCRILGELRKKGISGGVYTQTTDVEGELNGLITYDREVMKISPEKLYEIHKKAGLLD